MARAQVGDYLLAFIPRVIFVIVVIFSIVVLTNAYIKTEVQTFAAETNLAVQRLIYSGLAYEDAELGRSYPGVLDAEAIFSPTIEDRLSQSMHYPDARHLAAKIVVQDRDSKTLAEFYLNRYWYERWSVLTNFPGSGGSQSMKKRIYVLLHDERTVRMHQLEQQTDALSQDSWSRGLASQKQQELEKLTSNPAGSRLVPGYIEVTVVMPNS